MWQRRYAMCAFRLQRLGRSPHVKATIKRTSRGAQNGAVLVTNDRGRKERVILRLLAQHQVHALFVYNDLRAAPPHKLLYALLAAEVRMDEQAGRGLLHHKLKPTGRLERRG
jgi:hypothetical protein